MHLCKILRCFSNDNCGGIPVTLTAQNRLILFLQTQHIATRLLRHNSNAAETS